MSTNRRKITRNTGLAIAVAASTGLIAAACSSGSSSSTGTTTGTPAAHSSAQSSAPAASGSTSAAVLKTESSSLGTVLADGQGMTVYWFAADHGTTSACNGACASAWPPVTGTPSAASGVTLSGTLSTITRSDGTKQATYNGHPLYTFNVDTAPGQVNGNNVDGFGAKWYAITIGAGGTSATPASTGTGSGGY